MPTYDYLCRSGHRFELFERMSDPPEAECPLCGDTATRQISGGAGFIFRGEGFYITDYRSDSYRKAAQADSGAGGGDKDAGDGKPGDGASGKKGASDASGSGDAGGGGGGNSSNGGESASGSADRTGKRQVDV